jgi:hypothetical protein
MDAELIMVDSELKTIDSSFIWKQILPNLSQKIDPKMRLFP